jgi:uncharacterized protein with ATP-grasp and redox domains
MLQADFNCIPCLISQAIEMVQHSIKNKKKQREVINQILHFLEMVNLEITPAELLKQIHQVITEMSRNNDPYRDMRLASYKALAEKYDELKRLVYLSSDPVLLGVKLATMGNIFEYKDQPKQINLSEIIAQAQHIKLPPGDYQQLMKDLARFQKIIYLTNNAGEIVFDKLLIELLGRFYPEREYQFTVAVRGIPFMNEATREDADLIGLNKMVKVIDSGDNPPVMVFKLDLPEMSGNNEQARLVIAKGTTNFELLYQEKELIYFIFRVRCHYIAKLINSSVGSVILKRSMK